MKINAPCYRKRGAKDLIESTVNDLRKIKDVKAVILFGPHATGKQKPISDIDICVLTDKRIPDKTKAKIHAHASRKVEISLFWDLPPTVRYAALKEGKTLFSRDGNLMHNATIETMSEYLDFKHIIDRNIARVFGK